MVWNEKKVYSLHLLSMISTEGFPSAILVIYDNNSCSASLFFESDSKL